MLPAARSRPISRQYVIGGGALDMGKAIDSIGNEPWRVGSKNRLHRVIVIVITHVSVLEDVKSVKKRDPGAAARRVRSSVKIVAPTVKHIRVQPGEKRSQVDFVCAETLVAKEPVHLSGTGLGLIMNEIQVQRFSHRHDHIGIPPNKPVPGRMRQGRVIEHADPFRVAHEKHHVRADGLAHVVVRQVKPVLLELSVPVQVQVKTELAPWNHVVRPHIDRCPRVDQQVGHVSLKVVLIQRLSVGIHVAHISRIGVPCLEAEEADIIPRHSHVSDQHVHISEHGGADLTLGALQSRIGHQLRVGVIDRLRHRGSFPPAQRQKRPRHHGHH